MKELSRLNIKLPKNQPFRLKHLYVIHVALLCAFHTSCMVVCRQYTRPLRLVRSVSLWDRERSSGRQAELRWHVWWFGSALVIRQTGHSGLQLFWQSGGRLGACWHSLSLSVSLRVVQSRAHNLLHIQLHKHAATAPGSHFYWSIIGWQWS